MKQVFDIPAVQSWIKRYVDTLIFGKYNQTITNIATDRPIFFAKMKKNSTAVFNIKIDNPTMGGTICMAVSAGETGSLSNSGISILSTSIPSFFDNSKVYLAANVDGLVSDAIFVGFSVIATGLFDISIQAVSSERRGVAEVSYSIPINTVPNVAFTVSDGYLAGYPVIKPIKRLDAFHKWSSFYQYQAEDPTFFNGSAYFANPASIPNIGESPATHPGKWIQLARPDVGDIDLTEGARTPQLFYNPGLIISNSTALKLRQAHQDQGMRYPSDCSKVYHFDGDLLDQDQQNPLLISTIGDAFPFNDISISEFPWNDLDISEFEFNLHEKDGIFPHFINEYSTPEPPITMEPAILKKPFKEIAESYYGSYSIHLTMPPNDGQNVIDFWFKTDEGLGFHLLNIILPTGETFNLIMGFEEPFWNDNTGINPPNNFPFNNNVLLPGTLLFNERKSKTGLIAFMNHNGLYNTVELNKSGQDLSELNKWNHLSVNIGIESISIFINGESYSFARMSSGFGGNTSIVINPKYSPIVIDELLTDWTASVAFSRYDQASQVKLPWAYHEWLDGWLTLFANDPDKFDSNIALFIFPIGSVITQASINGIYNDSQTPWNRFHNFNQSQFILQGEISPLGGNGEKTKFWQRVS